MAVKHRSVHRWQQRAAEQLTPEMIDQGFTVLRLDPANWDLFLTLIVPMLNTYARFKRQKYQEEEAQHRLQAWETFTAELIAYLQPITNGQAAPKAAPHA